MRTDLQSLGNRGEPQFRGYCAAIPFHEGGTDFENLVTIHTDDLSDLSGVVRNGQIIFLSRADIHFAEQGAFGHDGQSAVNRGAGDGIIDLAGVIKELLGREMILLGKGGIIDGEPLIGHAQPFLGQVLAKLFTGSVVAHG